MQTDWSENFNAVITVCDAEGIIIDMNEKAAQTYEKDGGKSLIGTNALDCHPEPARTKMAEMLKNPLENVYTIEKKGKKKLVFQSPWYQEGNYAGIVEIFLVIPEEMPHFKRD